MARKRLGEILMAAGLIKRDQLEHALHEQQRWGGQLGKILIDQKVVTEELLMRALAKQLSLPIVDLSEVQIPTEVIELIPAEVAEEHSVIPFRVQSNFLDVAMSDPMNMGIIDELRIRTRLNVRPHLAAPSQIRRAINRNYRHEMDVDIDEDVDLGDSIAAPLRRTSGHDPMKDMREAEIVALQKRLSALETLVSRDENVIRKLLGLLIEKGVASREEILEAIK